MKRFFCVLTAFLLSVALLVPMAAATPQHQGITSITQAVQDAVGTDTPGAAVVLFENGTRILYEGYGYADIGARTLVTAQTGFEIGEISSLFVALTVQKLADAGQVELDRDIAYYLPADFMKKLDLSYAITLKDLLSGRAGFADRRFDLRYENPKMVFDTLEENLLADVPAQIAVPGTTFAYSHFGITLAAFVVERVSGVAYDAFVSEQILQPLGMVNTVLAPHAKDAERMAAGHNDKGEGIFALASEQGRTYSALWPADGAVCDAADLSLLMQYLLADGSAAKALDLSFENGVFQSGMAGLGVSGTVRALNASTAYFSAVLCLDIEKGNAALMLANSPATSLSAAVMEYSGFEWGVAVVSDGAALPAPTQYKGEYILCTKNGVSLFGRGVKNVSVSASEDGFLYFGERKLVQIAPGIFAEPERTDLAVLQFVTDVEGNVTGVVSATGERYRPAGFFENDTVADVLYAVLWIGALYFLAGGVLALADAILTRVRGERRPRAWRFTIPWILAAVNAICVLLQVLVYESFTQGAIASFFAACSVISLVVMAGAAFGFVYALFTGFTVRRMTGRVARSGIVYVLFLMLCAYWGISPL